MAKERRIKRDINQETGNVTFTVVASGKTLVANPTDIVPGHDVAQIKKFLGDTGWRAMLHAINAKVGDSAADKEKDALTVMTATLTQLKAGTWNVKGTGEGVATVLAEAVAQVQGVSIDEATDVLEAMSKEERKAVPEKYAKVKSAMEEIRAKRAQEKAKLAKKAAAADTSDLGELFASSN